MITNTTNAINIGDWSRRTTIDDEGIHLWIKIDEWARINEPQKSPVVECKELMQFLNDDEV